MRGWSRTKDSISRRVTDGESSESPWGDDAYSGQKLFGCDVLEEEAARAGDESVKDILVAVERRENQDTRRIFGGHDAACRLQAVHDGHADVHQHDVGPGPAGRLDGLRSIVGLGSDAQVLVGFEDHAESGPYEGLVVGDQDADAHAGIASPTGSRACSANPPSPVGRVCSLPS